MIKTSQKALGISEYLISINVFFADLQFCSCSPALTAVLCLQMKGCESIAG